MTRSSAIRATLLLLLSVLLMTCGEGEALTQAELRKLDARLQVLVASTEAPGVQKIVVLIHGSNPDEIRSIGTTIDAVAGEMIIARVSIPELKRIVRLSSVQSIESNTSKSPQH